MIKLYKIKKASDNLLKKGSLEELAESDRELLYPFLNNAHNLYDYYSTYHLINSASAVLLTFTIIGVGNYDSNTQAYILGAGLIPSMYHFFMLGTIYSKIEKLKEILN